MCSSSWSPALPTHAAGLAGTEQQEELTFTGARGLLWGYFGVFLFVLMNISSMRKKKKKNPSASTLICKQELWDMVGLMASHHPGQPEPLGGFCHPL